VIQLEQSVYNCIADGSTVRGHSISVWIELNNPNQKSASIILNEAKVIMN